LTATTASAAFLEALHEAGVAFLFANLGSDHPGLVEALAEARERGRPAPRLLTCPNEMVALSAAHGYAQVTGRAQAVLVHVECGTQALAGAVHNAARGRVPVLIFAGTSPFTQHGELRGSRNEFIHWIQDVFDQRGIVRGYVKYENELRTGRNVKQLVRRALQLAQSDPQGPVYLTAGREVLEEEIPAAPPPPGTWAPLAPAALAPEDVALVAGALAGAERPLVVTSYLGRNPAAVEPLVRLCRRLGAGVLESVPSRMNFPADDPLYLGNVWNEPRQHPALGAADVVLVVDSDVPWIPLVSRPGSGARIFHVDVDPLKQAMPLWDIGATRAFRADAGLALRQLEAHLATLALDPARVERRAAGYAALHEERRGVLRARERPPGSAITPEWLTACVRRRLDDEALVLSEGISSYPAIADHLLRTRPGSLLASGGGSLGWNGGAAIGAKLAAPDRTVVALTGDGSYLFSVPSTVHWMARRYETPFLQVVYDNGGWRSPKLSALAVHPDGAAARAADLGVSFAPAPDHAGVAAAAGGALARVVERPDELEPALEAGFHAVRAEGRCAVIDVKLPPV
jgi:acetolactate synthase-1/2/3 large subunit